MTMVPALDAGTEVYRHCLETLQAENAALREVLRDYMAVSADPEASMDAVFDVEVRARLVLRDKK